MADVADVADVPRKLIEAAEIVEGRSRIGIGNP